MKNQRFLYILLGLVLIALIGCGTSRQRTVEEKSPTDPDQMSMVDERETGSAIPLAPGTGLELGRLARRRERA